VSIFAGTTVVDDAEDKGRPTALVGADETPVPMAEVAGADDLRKSAALAEVDGSGDVQRTTGQGGGGEAAAAGGQ